MIKHIYDKTGIRLIGMEEAIPVCGEDFCDMCGLCLSCYSEDGCKGKSGRLHCWVEYQE